MVTPRQEHRALWDKKWFRCVLGKKVVPTAVPTVDAGLVHKDQTTGPCGSESGTTQPCRQGVTIPPW